MIVCLRTVAVPSSERERYLAWIAGGETCARSTESWRSGCLEPSSGERDTVVVTVWPSHEVFDAWIATPERDALTASEVHQAVRYRPVTRHDVVGGSSAAPLAEEVVS